MLDKPLADYSHSEALNEILKRVDPGNEPGHDVDLLVKQLSVLHWNLQVQYRDYQETVSRCDARSRLAWQWMQHTWTTKPGKNLRWDDFRTAFKAIDSGEAPQVQQ